MVKDLEDLSEVKLNFNDEITVEAEDPLKVLRVKEVLKAFGRGFLMKDCLNLLDENYYLEIIDISLFAGKSKRRLGQLRSRIIGTEGKTKKILEKDSETKISIAGKTVSIIGNWDRILIAKRAIEMLLDGSLHTTVYRYLNQNKR